MSCPHYWLCPGGWNARLNSDEKDAKRMALHIKIRNWAWRWIIGLNRGGQLWQHFLTYTYFFASTWSCFCSLLLFFSLHLPLVPHLVNYGESFISMGCRRLGIWFWVGCLRSTTPLSSLSGHSLQSHVSPSAQGKFHTHAAKKTDLHGLLLSWQSLQVKKITSHVMSYLPNLKQIFRYYKFKCSCKI